MPDGFDLEVCLLHHTFRVNEEGIPLVGTLIFLGHFFARVSQQVDTKIVLIPEFFVAFDAVRTDSIDDRAQFLKLTQALSKSPGLDGSAGGVVHGIEEKNEPLSFEIR